MLSKEIVEMYENGLSSVKIAKIIGIPASTVCSRLKSLRSYKKE